MNKPRKLAALALGLSLGLAGFGPAALAQRNGDHDAKSADSCSTSQENESTNETGDSAQSGLINLNNIALQGNNLDVLGNLLCSGVFLNDIVAGVLGFAEGGDSDGHGHGDGRGHDDDDAECSSSQENESDSETGDSKQGGLLNLNNVAVQGNNIGVGGNALCGSSFLNDVVAGILGSAEGGDGDHSDEGGADGCTTEQDNDSDNETGDSAESGLLNVNNIDALGNALCDSNFLNGLTAAILGSAEQGDDDGRHGDDDAAECSTEQENESDNETGDSVMGGLLNLNNLAVQGNNVGVLSNGLCGSIFLNDVLVSVLGVIG
jgi:hypothetical protein